MAKGSENTIKKKEFASVISLDPGKKHTGYAIWRASSNSNEAFLMDYGLIDYDAQGLDAIGAAMSLHDTIMTIPYIYKNLLFSHLFFENGFTQPGPAGEAFYNMTTMLRVACRRLRIEAVPIAPLSVKRIVAGSGKAEKNEVIDRINQLFNLNLKNQKPPKKHRKEGEEYSDTDHNIADAIGVGITGLTQLHDPVAYAGRGFDIFAAPLGVKRLDERIEDFDKNRKLASGARINKARRRV